MIQTTPKIDPRWDPPKQMPPHECEATVIESLPKMARSGRGYVSCKLRIDTGDYKDRTIFIAYTWLYTPIMYEFYKRLGLPVAKDDISKAVGMRFKIRVKLEEFEGRLYNSGRFLKRLD
jgi:hypothetical protein